MLRVGLIGERAESVPAHRAIPIALDLASRDTGHSVKAEWLATDGITSEECLSRFDGLWCVPASPYRSMDGAIRAIRFAREQKRPFLGTCGGFQHGVIEYARNVLGWAKAEHAETAPDAELQVIASLQCALVEQTDVVFLREGSRLYRAYGQDQCTEGYHCSYGLNSDFKARLAAGPLRVAATDSNGDVRGLELVDHPFYVMTLFQPERAALRQRLPPIVRSFVATMAARQIAPAARLQSAENKCWPSETV